MRKKILLLCYAAAAAVYLLGSLGLLCWDAFLYATGRMAPVELSLQDVETWDLSVTADDLAVCVGNDPQLLWNAAGQRVRSVYYRLQKPATGDVALYYTEVGQTDFSKKQIVLAPFGETQELLYKLPAGKSYHRIRLDVSSLAGEELVFESIVVNCRLPAGAYFVRTLPQWCALAFYPLLAACAVIWLMETAEAWKERRG